MRLALAGLSVFAAAVTLAAFLGLAKTLSSWRWTALAPPAPPPTRVPAVPVAEEPIVTAMTAADVDSVPARLEPRPRPFEPAEPEPETALGSIQPKAAGRAKKKPAARRPVFKTLKALAGSKPRLVMQEGADFDGGESGSAAYSEAEEAAPTPRGSVQATPSPAPPSAAPAPKRRLRSVSGRSSPRPLPAQTGAPEPAYEEEPGTDEE